MGHLPDFEYVEDRCQKVNGFQIFFIFYFFSHVFEWTHGGRIFFPYFIFFSSISAAIFLRCRGRAFLRPVGE